jgi:hypothetical protein
MFAGKAVLAVSGFMMNRDRVERLKSDIKLLVLMAHHPGFHELRKIPGFAGNEMLLVPDNRVCIVLWPWCSPEAVAAMNELITDAEIGVIHTPVHSYVYSDGPIPPLPITDRARIHGEPHWMPSYFRAKRMKRPDFLEEKQSNDWFSDDVGLH